MGSVDGFKIWLVMAKNGKPMAPEEIAAKLGAKREQVLKVLEADPRRFAPGKRDKWELTVWQIPEKWPFLAKAKKILWAAGAPVPEGVFLSILTKVHRQQNTESIRKVLQKKDDEFVFSKGKWFLTEKALRKNLDRVVEKVLSSLTKKLRVLLRSAKRPLNFEEIWGNLKVDKVARKVSVEQSLREEERLILEQQVASRLKREIRWIPDIMELPSGGWIVLDEGKLRKALDLLATQFLETKEILNKHMGLELEGKDLEVCAEYLERRFSRMPDMLRLPNNKWVLRKPFEALFTFYDPKTLEVVVEKGDLVEPGSREERWLIDRGFYETARFGGSR